MGSWNKTCGLSNLHITAGTPVYVFMLEERRDDSNCYTTSLFNPLLLPFESVYNDYGGGENSSGIAFELIINSLKEKLIELPIGENKYHDIEVTRDKMNEELMFESIHENRLFIPNWNNTKKTPVTFTMMRKDIVDNILENHSIQRYVGSERGTTGYNNSYVIDTFQTALDSIPALVDHLHSKVSENTYLYVFEMIDRLRPDYVAAEYLDIASGFRYSRLVNLNLVIGQLLLDNKLDEVSSLLGCILIGTWIEVFMSMTRKSWIPGGHEGSQSCEIQSHRVLCESIMKALDHYQAEIRDYTRDEG